MQFDSVGRLAEAAEKRKVEESDTGDGNRNIGVLSSRCDGEMCIYGLPYGRHLRPETAWHGLRAKGIGRFDDHGATASVLHHHRVIEIGI